MKWILLALHAAALASLLYSRLRMPAFAVYLLANSVMVASYQPTSDAWWLHFFVWYEPLLIVLRTLVTIEAMLLLADAWERSHLRYVLIGICALGGLMSFTGWAFHNDTTWFLTIRDLRAAEYIRLLLTCLIVVGISDPHLWSTHRLSCLHFTLWSIWVARQVAMVLLARAMPQCWHALDAAGYVVGSLCLFVWTLAFWLIDQSQGRLEVGRYPPGRLRTWFRTLGASRQSHALLGRAKLRGNQ